MFIRNVKELFSTERSSLAALRRNSSSISSKAAPVLTSLTQMPSVNNLTTRAENPP
ncbi:hypothetical protein J6590_097387 [Homalodisca vitripennis]|nr:hypothetical protein J6590_097387 [Homalodisca vitripennis]